MWDRDVSCPLKVCIVGHGPSLIGSRNGESIDSADVIVRLKQGWKQCLDNPDDYGTKIDVLMTSTETLGCFKDSGILDIKHYWCYPKFGWYEQSLIESIEKQIGKMTDIPLNMINKFNWRFRQTSGHPNVSLGMAAILYVKHYLEPTELVLAGFDTLLDPFKAFERNPNMPRTGVGPYPDHDWKMENLLLNQLRLNVRPI